MAARRAAPGKRWSATSTAERYDASGDRLPDDEERGVAKVKVRWRLDGHSRRATCTGPDPLGEARALQGLLAAAYEEGWDADDRYWPVPPAGRPATAPPAGPDRRSDARGAAPAAEAAATVVPIRRLLPPAALAAPPGPLPVPKAGEEGVPRDVAELVAWHLRRVNTTKKRRDGRPRSPKTTNGYENTLRFFTEIAVYRPGDPRLGAPGVEVGAPLRVDDPQTGVSAVDLVAAIRLREATNLRVRAANERAMRRWAAAVAAEEGRAAKQRRRPVLPEPPELRPETPEARTVEELCRAVKAAFEHAYRHQKIAYQPWTADVDDEVVHAGPVRYTRATVASRAQLWRLAEAMARHERVSTDAEGRPCTVTDERYEAMVALAGIKGPRPEETIAIRDSWVQLDGDAPRITLHNAEVYHPLGAGGGGRHRTRVELKHRPPGTVRVLHLDNEPELVEKLRRHRERFVPAPVPDSDDPDERDPHFFTTHRGLPVDPSNWGPKWWKPVVHQALSHPGEEHLRNLPFRRLRAAAITHWLAEEGRTLHWCATEAGNSQAVIEAHYQGVLAEIGYDPVAGRAREAAAQPPRGSAGGLPLDAANIGATLQAADEVALAQLYSAAREELRRRVDDSAVSAPEPARLH